MTKHLHVERDPGRNPVFQVLLQVMPAMPAHLGELEVSSFRFDPGTAQVDLGLHLYEEAGAYTGRLEYCSALFDAATMRTLSSQFTQALRAIVREPAQPISRIGIVTDAERNRLVSEWNAPVRFPPDDDLVQRAFEAHAARAPERIAVTCGANELSYAELDARANAIAHALRARGADRGERIGLCLERGVDMLAALLGILKTGGAYVPLDPAFPVERLRYMADDARLGLLVSSAALAAAFALPRERQLLLDADAGAIAAQSRGRVACNARGDDPAYVIYTSGSTGKPKGVVVPHRAVVNFLHSMAREPGLVADDVLVAVTTLSFDIAVLELQLPLAVGASVVIASRAEAVEGRALGALVAQHRATAMQATPVTWRVLLESGWNGRPGFKALVGGEALPRDLADRLLACDVELWNLYGPTETTVWSTCARIDDTANGITIGKPIANTVVRVVDVQQNLCPIGVPGELCIGGAGVSLGYWNRPELTAERFVPDPFGAGMLYRTGDRARWRNDGMLEHLGRLDDQVKVRGFRIELGEIEAVLREHPSVREAAARVWAPKAGDVRIVACCVPAKGQVQSPIQLRRHVRARLPEYMVPQHFLTVDAIALTANGKVDRRRLPTPVVSESGIGRQHESPADPSEAAIAAIWTKLIAPAQPIGRFDRFFEVGGHSLLGIQALRQIEDRLGVRLEFTMLFQESLADLAARCRA
jgi:amino acid adenylation domain-containing protein